VKKSIGTKSQCNPTHVKANCWKAGIRRATSEEEKLAGSIYGDWPVWGWGDNDGNAESRDDVRTP
jgi:hypothetical protein